MIAIVDYGVGNLFSLVSSFKAIGVKAVLTSDKKVIESADKIILPGVGAFGDASDKLFASEPFIPSLVKKLPKDSDASESSYTSIIELLDQPKYS